MTDACQLWTWRNPETNGASRLRTVVAFCGAAGCGKDEAARVLTERHGFEKRSFAEALRREVRRAFTDESYCDQVWHEMPLICRDAFQECEYMRCLDPWQKPTPEPMRILLQVWGTEFRRAQSDGYWINREIEALPAEGSFVYTDVRFPNEYEMVRSLGGSVYRIERDGVTGNGHVSESHWPTFAHDGVLRNDGTVEEFRALVARAMDELCALHEDTLP
jgi:hypothetical protein